FWIWRGFLSRWPVEHDPIGALVVVFVLPGVAQLVRGDEPRGRQILQALGVLPVLEAVDLDRLADPRELPIAEERAQVAAPERAVGGRAQEGRDVRVRVPEE